MEKIKLGEIATIASGSTPSREENAFWQNGNHCWIRSNQIGEYKIMDSNEKISDIAVKKCNLKLFPKGSILIAISGQGQTRGKVSLLNIDSYINQNCAGIIVNGANNEFIYYNLLNSYERLRNISCSTRNHLNCDILENFIINLPEKEKQHHIVDIIGSIDDSINIKKLLVDKLLELINTNFDFLMNNANYQPVELSSIAITYLGGTPNTKIQEYWNGNIPWINSGRLNDIFILDGDEMISYDGLKHSSSVLCKKNSIVVSITGNIMISILGIDAAINQSIVALETCEEYRCFLYFYLKKSIPHLSTLRSGAVQPHINKDILEKYKILLPSKEEIEKFNKYSNWEFKKFMELCYEIKKLECYKSFLLPLLLNEQAL